MSGLKEKWKWENLIKKRENVACFTLQMGKGATKKSEKRNTYKKSQKKAQTRRLGKAA